MNGLAGSNFAQVIPDRPDNRRGSAAGILTLDYKIFGLRPEFITLKSLGFYGLGLVVRRY